MPEEVPGSESESAESETMQLRQMEDHLEGSSEHLGRPLEKRKFTFSKDIVLRVIGRLEEL